MYKPGTKRVLDGQDRKQLSMPPVLLHASWAFGAGLAFGRHFTISEKKEKEKWKKSDTARPRTLCIHLHTVVKKGWSGNKAKSQAQAFLKRYIRERGSASGSWTWASKWNSFTFSDLNSRSVFPSYSSLRNCSGAALRSGREVSFNYEHNPLCATWSHKQQVILKTQGVLSPLLEAQLSGLKGQLPHHAQESPSQISVYLHDC